MLGPSRFLYRDSQGSILILAVWVLSVLGIFSLSIGYQVRQKVALAQRLDLRNLLYGIAEVGIYRGLILVKEPDPSPNLAWLGDPWSSNEKEFKDISIGEGSYSVAYEYDDAKNSSESIRKTRYGLQDEESKINLNSAHPEVLSRLFQAASGSDREKAAQIAHSIVDWRDSDSFQSDPSYGAEDDYYNNLDPPYEAKNAPFEVLQELLLVRGVDPEIFERVEDQITIYGEGKVNINTASKEVLIALGLDEKTAEAILVYRAGIDRESGTEDDRAFSSPGAAANDLAKVSSLGAAEGASLTNLVAAGLLTTASNHFRIQSIAQARGYRMILTAVVNREGKILFWHTTKPQHLRNATPPS